MPEIPNPDSGTEDETVTPPAPPASDPAPVDPPAPAPAPIDYEEKFKQSAREAQVLASQLEEERKRNTKPLTIDPTEQELRDMYPDWDSFLPSEKLFAKENLTLKRTVQATTQSVAEIRADQAWQKDLKNAVKTFPQLAGREAEFEQFVFKPTHKGVSIEALAKAFLYDATAAPAPTPSSPPEGSLERGGSGQRIPPKPKLLSAAELKLLRETDSRGYKAYVTKNPEALDID